MKPEEGRDLLPWYAADALAPEEKRQVEALLREQPHLDRELAEWRALQSVVTEVGADEPEFRAELIDEAHRRIDAYEATRAATAPTWSSAGSSAGSSAPSPAASPAPSTRRRERRPGSRAAGTAPLLQRLFGIWDATPFGARVAMAAQLAVVAVLVTVLGVRQPEDFITASGNSGPLPEGHRGVTVVFDSERPLREIHAVLEATGAQIVSGPSSQSAYVLDLGEIDETEAARVLDSLRNNAPLVRFANPVE